MTRKQEATQKFNQVRKLYKKYNINIKKGHTDYASKSLLANLLIASL